MPEKTLDQSASEKLGIHPEQVAIYRDQWEQNPQSSIIRTLYWLKLETLRQEKLTKLRNCEPEDLKTLQGALDALDVAMSILATRIVT